MTILLTNHLYKVPNIQNLAMIELNLLPKLPINSDATLERKPLPHVRLILDRLQDIVLLVIVDVFEYPHHVVDAEDSVSILEDF